MARNLVLGVDVGTSSTKGVLVDASSGAILQSAVRHHEVVFPAAGHVEMDAAIWWEEFVSIVSELTAGGHGEVTAVGLSGMGPCTLVTEADGTPLRRAILYGIDTRSVRQIKRLNDLLGDDKIQARCGSRLTSQAVGPKLAWIAEYEPAIWRLSRRLFMPASWLAHRLTGEYVLDFHSASQCTPLFDIHEMQWHQPWAEQIAPYLELPELKWPAEPAGRLTEAIAGIPAGVPVTVGTIDAWTEAISVDAHNTGDLMLMYGTTMFMINTVESFISHDSMWSTIGALPGTRNLAGGMATSGAITGWLRNLTGSPDYEELLDEAAAAPAGSNGLLVLPYFAGERTPLQDPLARGIIVGLNLSHTRGDIYRAVLEATAYAVRHNVETMREAGGTITRIVAGGGGTQGTLWPQIVSDITGLEQVIPQHTIGASYGAAYLAATIDGSPDITAWNPPERTVTPNPETAGLHDENYRLFRSLYEDTKTIIHSLATRQLQN